MIKIVHIINPVIKPDSHELSIAQPITFESMRIAKTNSIDPTQVELWAVMYPEDESYVPKYFKRAPYLKRSFQDIKQQDNLPKLPLISDILHSLGSKSSSEYLIYSNVDIALMPYFYTTVNNLLNKGWDSLLINRRTIYPEVPSVEDMLSLFMLGGDPHPGYDCFVFPVQWLSEFELGNLCVGLPGYDWLLAINIWLKSKNNFTIKDAHLTFHIGDKMNWKSSQVQTWAKINYESIHDPLEKLRKRYGDIELLKWPRPNPRKHRSIFTRIINKIGRKCLEWCPSPK
jgi:hypothetical protein